MSRTIENEFNGIEKIKLLNREEGALIYSGLTSRVRCLHTKYILLSFDHFHQISIYRRIKYVIYLKHILDVNKQILELV